MTTPSDPVHVVTDGVSRPVRIVTHGIADPVCIMTDNSGDPVRVVTTDTPSDPVRVVQGVWPPAPSIPWYLQNGITLPNVAAAYKPKDALNFLDSKIDVAHPGVNDLLNGTAFPSWTPAGWTFDRALSQYLLLNYALITAAPCTFICRLSVPSSSPEYDSIVSMCGVGGSFQILGMDMNVPIKVTSYNADGVATPIFTTPNPATLGVDFTATVVHDSPNSRSIYFNGIDKVTNAVACTPTNLVRTFIGVTYFGGAGYYYYLSATIKAIAIYKVAFSDAQVLIAHNKQMAL